MGAKAIQIADGRVNNTFLPHLEEHQETVCSCEVVMEPSLSQALHLLNGDTTNKRIKQGKVVSNYLKDGKKPDRLLMTLSVTRVNQEKRKKLIFWPH